MREILERLQNLANLVLSRLCIFLAKCCIGYRCLPCLHLNFDTKVGRSVASYGSKTATHTRATYQPNSSHNSNAKLINKFKNGVAEE